MIAFMQVRAAAEVGTREELTSAMRLANETFRALEIARQKHREHVRAHQCLESELLPGA